MTGPAPSCWVLIPLKAPGAGKTRLAGVLDVDARERLVDTMLTRVITAAQACALVDRVCLVGPSRHGLGDDILWFGDEAGDLNNALSNALRQLGIGRPASSRVIVLPADLPQLTPADIAMLAQVPDHCIGIAPDRHGTGTNALSLPATALTRFAMRFGPGSHSAHRAEAQRLGYSVETMLSDGLEKDIDEPADLADARGCLSEAS